MGGNLQIDGNIDWSDGTIAFQDTGTSPLSGDLTINVGGNFTVTTTGNATFDFSEVEALDSGNYTLVSANGTLSADNNKFTAVHGNYTTLFGFFTTANKTVNYTVTGATSGGPNIQNNGGPNTPVIADYTVDIPTITVGTNNTVSALNFSNNGSLTINATGQLTVSSGNLTVNSGASIVSGGNLTLPGNFTKAGSGELDLQSDTNVNGVANVVEGLLSVNGNFTTPGGLVVDPGATLGGSGLIVGNVNVGGILAPGNSPGTLTIVGNLLLTGANSTIIEIASPTNFDRIVVSGQASLGGTLQALPYAGGSITPGTSYEFLQAASITGNYSSILVPDGLRGRFLNLGTVGVLLFGPESFVPYALNSNQANVAAALNTFVTATTGDTRQPLTKSCPASTRASGTWLSSRPTTIPSSSPNA
jgi:hypothetical protein